MSGASCKTWLGDCPSTSCCSNGICYPPGQFTMDALGKCHPGSVDLTDRCTSYLYTNHGVECGQCAPGFDVDPANATNKAACQWTQNPNFWSGAIGLSCTDESNHCKPGASQYCTCVNTNTEGNCIVDPGDPGEGYDRGPDLVCDKGMYLINYEYCGMETQNYKGWTGSREGLVEGFRGGWALNHDGWWPMEQLNPMRVFNTTNIYPDVAAQLAISSACNIPWNAKTMGGSDASDDWMESSMSRPIVGQPESKPDYIPYFIQAKHKGDCPNENYNCGL